MILPYVVFTLTDPQMNILDVRLHTMAFYLPLSIYTVNTLLFSLLNQQIKSAFIEIVNRIVQRKKPAQEGRMADTTG
jgi:hypothetical protein